MVFNSQGSARQLTLMIQYLAAPGQASADQSDSQVRREMQQLFSRKLLAHHNLAAQVNPTR